MTLFRNKYRIETARLRNWDYASAGWYFVTICTQGRMCFFGEVNDHEMHLSAIGAAAFDCWQAIPSHSPPNVHLDVFVVMPNHLHGIIVIEDVEKVEDTRRQPSSNLLSQISPQRGSLGAVIRSYKSAVTRWCGLNHHLAFAWQPRFHDRIIRDAAELMHIRAYIDNNPANWDTDRDKPSGLWM
jgi:REP element-mobilizing transposase RayT